MKQLAQFCSAGPVTAFVAALALCASLSGPCRADFDPGTDYGELMIEAAASGDGEAGLEAEAARNEKKIGKSLEAHITLVRAQDQADNLTALQEKFQDQWADLFIVSDVEVSDDPALYAQGSDTPIAGVRVLVSEANGDKCERCWKYSADIGTHAAHPTLCARCAAVVEG